MEDPDFSLREMSVTAVMIISLVLLGLYPQPVLNTAGQSIDNLQKIVKKYRASAAEWETQADWPADNRSGVQPVSDSRGNQ